MNKKIQIEIENFLKKYKLVKYKKGQILVRPGDLFGKVILEKTGFARVYKATEDEREISWPILKPMWLYSLITAIGDKKNEYYVETVTAMEAWVVPVDEFLNFLETKKGILEEIYRSTILDLVDLTEKIEKLVLADAYTKVAILINELAINFGKKKGKEIIIDFNIPHRVLASITGLTRETVTLQILKMQKEGILHNQGREMVIKEIKKLDY
ncbi:MAG: Crp/Fnr family transcriptional regulator [Candidatus Shapirobacteria bacterium]